MDVILISYSNNPVRLVAAAAKLCYSKYTPSEVYDRLTDENSVKLLKDLKLSGHMSPFEHANFTFGVSGISRVTTHQLVRHRMASYSQQSQRYVSMSKNPVIIPPSAYNSDECVKTIHEAAEAAQGYYNKLIELGMNKEDARYILPHGGCSNIIFTMNARELMHFFKLRLCRRAQWEIRELAKKMLGLVLDAAPELFVGVGPACMEEGCHETAGRSCGNPFHHANTEEETKKILGIEVDEEQKDEG